MARVGKERPRVGQHPYKTAQQAEHGKGVHLRSIPSFWSLNHHRTELYLARHAPVLEITNHRGHHLVGRRVQVVEDGLGEDATAVQAVKEPCHGEGGVELADGIETRIRPHETHHPTVGIAYRPVMELLCPSFSASIRANSTNMADLKRAHSAPSKGVPPYTLSNNRLMSFST